MEDTAPIAAARAFLALMESETAPDGRELLKALDKLAMAYHETAEGDPSESDATPPNGDYKQRHDELGERFSQFGYYAVCNPIAPVDNGAMVGDAIDDLADISADLAQVIWRWNNLGPDDAHWNYRFLFEIHWGMHLRELSLYLHAKTLRLSEANGNPSA